MKSQIRWGILSTAKIAREKVIPAMQTSQYCIVDAICSRSIERAQETAALLNIKKAYGSYEELLNDAEIDAIYIPLPNHLHVEWGVKCLAAGKHVLIEKPISLSVKDAEILLAASKKYPHLKVMEAFMYRFHPQWIYTEGLVKSKWLGKLKSIQSFFSYNNTDPNNIRNKVETGGGGLMDIGCYCVSLTRLLFGEEPLKVIANVEYDPITHTDSLVSGMMMFNKGASSFTCSTKLMPYQSVNIIGDLGRIEIEIPFNPTPTEQTKITLYKQGSVKNVLFSIADQYTLQADSFAKAIIQNQPVPYALNDAVQNMAVIEALFESNRVNNWINVQDT